MVIAQLNGGLGNQLFQYAAAKSLSLHHDVPLLLEVSSFYRDDLPELEVPREFELYNFIGVKEPTVRMQDFKNNPDFDFLKASKIEKLLPKHRRTIYTEPFYHFDSNFFDSKKNVLIKGQWQSEKYFAFFANILKESLQLKQELITNCRQKAEEMQFYNSVSVHVRRADYLRKQIILEWHGVMGKDYYANAFDTLDKTVGDFRTYYFTDDPEWVTQELFPLREGELISGVFTKNHYEDFFLMSACKYNVIANSSFSWWAAWLNKNPQKVVIGPAKWFDKGPKDTQDIIPSNWIKI